MQRVRGGGDPRGDAVGDLLAQRVSAPDDGSAWDAVGRSCPLRRGLRCMSDESAAWRPPEARGRTGRAIANAVPPRLQPPAVLCVTPFSGARPRVVAGRSLPERRKHAPPILPATVLDGDSKTAWVEGTTARVRLQFLGSGDAFGCGGRFTSRGRASVLIECGAFVADGSRRGCRHHETHPARRAQRRVCRRGGGAPRAGGASQAAPAPPSGHSSGSRGGVARAGG